MPKVLIADDEAPVSMALREALSNAIEGIKVEIALNGEEAHEKLLKENYDVALLDIYMPGMNGLDIAQCVKERGIDTDIVIITGKGTIDDTIKALGIQIEELITKPFRYDKVVLCVREILEKRYPGNSNFVH